MSLFVIEGGVNMRGGGVAEQKLQPCFVFWRLIRVALNVLRGIRLV